MLLKSIHHTVQRKMTRKSFQLFHTAATTLDPSPAARGQQGNISDPSWVEMDAEPADAEGPWKGAGRGSSLTD